MVVVDFESGMWRDEWWICKGGRGGGSFDVVFQCFFNGVHARVVVRGNDFLLGCECLFWAWLLKHRFIVLFLERFPTNLFFWS